MEPIKSNGTTGMKAHTAKVPKVKLIYKKAPGKYSGMEGLMNPKELKVVEVIVKAGPSGIKLADIAAKAFAKKGTAAKTKGNSWVRNSVRRPLLWGLIRKMERGTYVVTAYGNKTN